AMPGGGRLVIHTANLTIAEAGVAQQTAVKPGSYVSLTVRDTGVGMDDETRSCLFDPFFTTKEPGKGTGLGLAGVYGIVRQSGGHLLVDSRPGQGTVFQILLPPVAEDTRVVEAEPRPDLHARGTERVLLVEDEEMVRDYALQVLTLFGYEVIEAAGGEEALEIVRTGPRPALLLTDVVMPKMSGPELARIIKDRHPEVQVIYMSGYATEEMGDRPDRSAAFIAKPFTPEQLAHKVRQVLDDE
ncbi:MAG: response regulator, partial [Proteobacteria bacterium]|nr:response regulator [Pseudomonadota bacterium]